MNIQKFLDSKHGNILGRVYFLILLFFGNALIPIGAVIKFLHNGSGVLMIAGLLITVIANGLDIMGVSSHWQKIVKGAIIVLAVLIDIKGKRRKD